MELNSDALYWLFSTIAQTYGAIVAVFVAIIVYRLQNLSDAKREALIRADDAMSVGTFPPASPDDLVNTWREPNSTLKALYEKDSKLEPEHFAVDTEVRKIETYVRLSNSIRNAFKNFLFVHIIIIVVAVVALPFSWYLLRYFWWIIWLLIVVVVISGLLIFRLGKSITET